MLELDDDGRVRRYHIKQRVPGLTYSWIMAAWGPRFTQFLHEFVRERLPALETDPGAAMQEMGVAPLMRAAVESGLTVQTALFPQGRFLDIGTVQGLSQLATSRDFCEIVDAR